MRHGRRERVLTGSELETTNNRMELQAAISALEAMHQPSLVELYTDSQYLQKGITSWLAKWIAQGWMKSDKKPVMNVDLWQRLDALTHKHEVNWHWIRGHSGNRQNERANQLAYEAIPRSR
jgi:ribonuclease HI